MAPKQQQQGKSNKQKQKKTMNTSVTMTDAMEKALKTCTTDFAQVVVKALSEKYGFDEAEALAHLELDGTKVVRKAKAAKTPKEPKAPKAKMLTPSMPLPFCGVVMDEWCKGIRPNHDLFTQCTMAPKKGGFYCATCAGQAEANETNKPTHGDIRDRKEAGDDWRSPAGKQPMNYGNVLKKKNLDKEAAIAEATAFGWEISEEQFEVKARKPGRPKSPSTSDTEDEAPKKKRGRPSKKKGLVSGDADDFIGQLMNNIQNNSEADTEASSSDEEASVPVEETKEAEAPKEVEAPKEAEDPKEAEEEPKEVKKKAKKAKPELTEEEKEAKKKAAAEKRKATAARKKAEKEAAEKEAAEKKAAEEAAKKAAEVEAEAVSSDDELASQPDEDSDGEEASVEEVEFNGKTYYKDDDNTVYEGPMENPTEVGTWDEENKKVVFNDED